MKKERITIILVIAFVLAAAVGAIYMISGFRAETERNLSCQSRCEPRRWKILEDHCYCRDQPDEWHGIDKGEPNVR